MDASTATPPPASPQPSYWTKLYHQIETAPCFRVPLMWGIACGVLAGCHKFRIHRASPQAIMNACDFGVLGIGISTSLGWWICERERRKEAIELRRMMELQGIKPMSELESSAEKR